MWRASPRKPCWPSTDHDGDTQIAPEATIVLLIVLTLPIAWLVSELTEYRSLRVGLGIAAITSMFGVSFLVGSLSRLNYNSSYGGASKDLIETTVSQIENGEIDRVMSVLRRLNLDYKPTYENRAHYDELVRDAVEQMKGRADLDGTRWDASPFTRETWDGHWENDTGFWLVIKRNGEFQITRSGDTPSQIDKLIISDDFKSLAFIEGNQWSHELKLVNKFEATHTWKSLNNGSTWQSETLHKLVRATSEQRAFTQQSGE